MRPWGPHLCTLLLGCSSLGEGESIVAIELRIPSPAVVEQNDTIWLNDTIPFAFAVALNLAGEIVPATIEWLAGDTTVQIVGIDSLTTDTTAGTGRIQARIGRLRSELISFSIRRKSDTLVIVGSATDTVLAGDSASAPLVAAVLSLTPDTAGIGGTKIHYVIDSGPVGTVHFAGDVSELFAPTGSTGEPVPPVTLRRVPGTTGTVIVTVDAIRPSGQTVPGPGQSFIVVFE